MQCKKCGAKLDMTMAACAACGAEVELGRLTGILGIVCRGCDAYNEPGAKTCIACGKPLGASDTPPPFEAPAPPQEPEKPVPPPAPAPPPVPGAPVVRSFQKPSAGAATRFVPAALKPSAGAPSSSAPGVRSFPPAGEKPGGPALTPAPGGPIALQTTCPRCGAQATQGRFCAQCGQALGARGTQVTMKPPAPGRTATQVFGALAPGKAKLVLEGGDAFEGATFRLNAESVEAGRSKGVVIFPSDACLAPHHATFFYRGGALHVRDEGAPGGIYLRLRGLSVPLRAGDHFAVGDRLLKFAGLLPNAPTPPPDGTRRLGAPRPTHPALVIEEWLEGGLGGRVFIRSGPAVTIGRSGCAVNLGDDPRLSQSHAEIVVEQDGTARLRDLGSSNGTYAKIPPHGERELRDGDCVRMGHEVLRVVVAEEPRS
jgi:pSer/pThr/pTyr-binding forkhead associated (FHA) protein